MTHFSEDGSGQPSPSPRSEIRLWGKSVGVSQFCQVACKVRLIEDDSCAVPTCLAAGAVGEGGALVLVPGVHERRLFAPLQPDAGATRTLSGLPGATRLLKRSRWGKTCAQKVFARTRQKLPRGSAAHSCVYTCAAQAFNCGVQKTLSAGRLSEFDMDSAEMGAASSRRLVHDDDATEAFDGIAEEIKKAGS